MWQEGVRVIEDIWDPVEAEPTISENLTPAQKGIVKRSITSIIGGLPDFWATLIHVRLRDWERPSQPNLNFVFGREAEENKESLQTWGFPRVYRQLIATKLKSIAFEDRTKGPLDALRN
jgi:hypothetical protein